MCAFLCVVQGGFCDCFHTGALVNNEYASLFQVFIFLSCFLLVKAVSAVLMP